MKQSKSDILKSMKRIDVMVDIETLGTDSDATIIQIAAIAFDILTGTPIKEFNLIADIEQNDTLTIDGSTLKWWLDTDAELLSKLLNSGDTSSEDILKEFRRWLIDVSHLVKDNNMYLWGNGILFDNKMIQHQMELIDIEYPVHYQNDRDVRTIVDLTSHKLGISEQELKESYDDDSLRAHDAYDDVIYQINLVSGCYKILTS